MSLITGKRTNLKFNDNNATITKLDWIFQIWRSERAFFSFSIGGRETVVAIARFFSLSVWVGEAKERVGFSRVLLASVARGLTCQSISHSASIRCAPNFQVQ